MKRKLMILVPALLLVSCSSGGGGSGSSSGEFLDSPVEGMDYVAGTTTGMTTADGGFRFKGGQLVQFLIGDILVGEGNGLARMTPVQLVPGAQDQTDPFVTNIARFLQTVDDDGDPSNGILITPAVSALGVGASVNFNQSIAAFQADPNVLALVAAMTGATLAGQRPLVSAQAAQDHLEETLLGIIGGRYNGTYAGDDRGSWEAFIGKAGNLVGWGNSNSDGFFNFTGSVTADGTAIFGNTSAGASFEGVAGTDSSLSGTWDNSFFLEDGTFFGTQNLPLLAFIESSVLAQISGSYACAYSIAGDSGPFTLTVDGTGAVLASGFDGEAALGIVSILPDGVGLAGLGDDGTRISGTILFNGSVSGSLDNSFFGEHGSFSGSQQ